MRSNFHTNIFINYSEGEERGRGETKHTLRVLSRDGSQQCLLCFKQLEKLLQCAQAKLTKNNLVLFTGCALFVCNKWHLIQPNDQKEVKEAQVAKLSKKLPNLDPGKQMVYLSCKTAQTCQKFGYITPDFNNLIAGISHLIVSAMQNKLEMHFRYFNAKSGQDQILLCNINAL